MPFERSAARNADVMAAADECEVRLLILLTVAA